MDLKSCSLQKYRFVFSFKYMLYFKLYINGKAWVNFIKCRFLRLFKNKGSFQMFGWQTFDTINWLPSQLKNWLPLLYSLITNFPFPNSQQSGVFWFPFFLKSVKNCLCPLSTTVEIHRGLPNTYWISKTTCYPH